MTSLDLTFVDRIAILKEGGGAMVEEKVEEEVKPEPKVEKDEEKQQPVAVEAGKVSPSQMAEVEAGAYYTVGQLASKLNYSRAWISYHCKHGLIRAVKPLGQQWRIPKSEYERMTKEGVRGLPREPKKKPVVVLEVAEDKVAKVAEEKPKEGEKEKKESWFPIDFKLW